MAYLLISVTMLHLITLAMLFIATMEKVIFTFMTNFMNIISKEEHFSQYVLCSISFKSPGGCGIPQKPQTFGTTVGLTTQQELGCVKPPEKQVSL